MRQQKKILAFSQGMQFEDFVIAWLSMKFSSSKVHYTYKLGFLATDSRK